MQQENERGPEMWLRIPMVICMWSLAPLGKTGACGRGRGNGSARVLGVLPETAAFHRGS